MPVQVHKKGSSFIVVDHGGKVFGTHPTQEMALKQVAAINAKKKKRT